MDRVQKDRTLLPSSSSPSLRTHLPPSVTISTSDLQRYKLYITQESMLSLSCVSYLCLPNEISRAMGTVSLFCASHSA